MRVLWVTGFLDSPSREAEPFWLAVTGTTLSGRRGGGAFATLLPADGDACLRVQVIGASEKPKAHVDLHVADVPAAAGEARALGAAEVFAEEGLVVLRSPAGVLFCLVAWGGQSERPEPVRWPGGQASVVDQLSLDIPARDYDAEMAFWAELTGWERRASDLPGFAFLQGDASLPMRFLLQRIGSGAAGVHLDLACDGVDAEVERHVGLGASVVRRVPGDWTTLRDPLGREYCVTGRAPRGRG
ncbi:VOC family protein [Actinoplanes sp. NPDC026619]|uniref:VOC family protein n=1 Tax=Actinoplanes sp. NPDC026619 TaxID=3155798 RepID=UPI0033E66503